ncbi:hypothetical protein C4K00_2063 [Pseudomonas synxantha]|nr:hypothetical protein C4K00_2063 [Pseudomonas synxantha]
MAVDLGSLPERRLLPRQPRHWRWCVVILLCSLVVGGLMVLLWRVDSWHTSLWFWSCTLLGPLILGLVFYALRLSAYEKHRDYIESWNESRDELEQSLIRCGQRTVAVLGVSYCSGSGNNQLAQALRLGSKPLQPIYLEGQALTMRLSQLIPSAQSHSKSEYIQRLHEFLNQVVRTLESDLEAGARGLAVDVRIKHNQVLCNEELLSIWSAVTTDSRLTDRVVFAMDDDGVMWLDAWLDDPERHQLLVSVEINLFLDPVAEQAETVTAVLLGSSEWCIAQKIDSIALVHRPVQLECPGRSIKDAVTDAFLWGQLRVGEETYFSWQAQVPGDVLRETSIAVNAARFPFNVARCHRLDDSFGLPGCAVGNVALIVASECAKAEGGPQVVLLQDASAQIFIVRPA